MPNPETLLNIVANVINLREVTIEKTYNLIIRNGHIKCIPKSQTQPKDIVVRNLRESGIKAGFTIPEWNHLGEKLAIICKEIKICPRLQEHPTLPKPRLREHLQLPKPTNS